MKKKLASVGLIAIALFGTTACTTVPPLDFTVPEVGVVDNRKDAELVSLTIGFAPQTQQRRMQAGQHVAPIWKEALTDAVNRSLIFADESDLRVNLSVRIIEFDLPDFGADLKTTVAALYEVVDRSSGDVLMTEEISSEGVVPFGYALSALVRQQESANRAVRNNIAEFVSRLEASDFGRPVFPATS